MIDLSYLFNNPNSGKGSITRTAFTSGFIVATLKLLLSGVQITSTYKFPVFTGVEFAAVAASLGTVYALAKNNAIKAGEKAEKDSEEA